MCIDYDGHHTSGSSFVYVSVIKKKSKESQYIVWHLELGSDPPIGSDRESGCDMGNRLHGTFPILIWKSIHSPSYELSIQMGRSHSLSQK